MKILNKYTYLFLGILIVSVTVIINFIPNLETEEFDQAVIDNIIEGVTTTTVATSSNDNLNENIESTEQIDELVLSEEQISDIDKILTNNNFDKEINDFDTYLLIGSDERSEEIALTRGQIIGKRADVIILGLVNKNTQQITLLSFPRDLLIRNNCTGELERINASYIKNDCGGRAENLAAAIYSISGIRVTNFASFDFEGFEEIIDSVDGVEICVEKTQKEGFSFELQKGCKWINNLKLGSFKINSSISR